MKVSNPNNLPIIPIADLLPSQGDLKDLTEKNYNKLKKDIEKRGFILPVFVWESPDKSLYLLDGHQRQRVLTQENWTEPIPYIKVPAKDMTEAMEILLEITSQFGTLTQEGYDQFIGTYKLNEAEVFEAVSYDALKFHTQTDANDDDFDLLERKVIEIEFEADELMEELYNELTERGYKCKLLTL